MPVHIACARDNVGQRTPKALNIALTTACMQHVPLKPPSTAPGLDLRLHIWKSLMCKYRSAKFFVLHAACSYASGAHVGDDLIVHGSSVKPNKEVLLRVQRVKNMH